MARLEQLLARARPVPKVTAALIAFAMLQVLEHFGLGAETIGLERETAVALIVLAVMWLRRDRRRRPVEPPIEVPAGRERVGSG